MARARFWKLHINLDTFNAAFAALDSDQERSDFVVGLSRGMNAGKVKPDCSDPMSVGYAIGDEMRKEVEGFREQCVLNGPKRKSNKKHHTVDHTVHHMVDGEATERLTERSTQSINPLIHKEVPPIAPLEGGMAGRRKRAPKQKQAETWMQPYDDDILSAVARIKAVWPTHSCKQPRSDALVPHTNFGELASRLSQIRADGADLEVLVAIALEHAKAFHDGKTGAPAAHNYFGMRGFQGGPPPWKAAYQHHVTARVTNEEHPPSVFEEEPPRPEREAVRVLAPLPGLPMEFA